MTAFNRFEKEMTKEWCERKPIKLRQGGLRYLITKNHLKNLFESYRDILVNKDYISIPYKDKDLAAWLVVLRHHFKLWVEFEAKSGILKIYKNFPEAFMVTKEVNKENHWFIEETIHEGTILYPSKDNYGVVNWLNGIPLSKSNNLGCDTLYNQINYDFIKPL